MAHLQQAAEHFLAHGWALIDAPVMAQDPEKIKTIFQTLKKVIKEEVLQGGRDYTFDYYGAGDPDDGLVYRSKKDGYDDKIFWHYRPRLVRLYEHRFETDPSENFVRVSNFCSLIQEQIEHLILKFLQELDHQTNSEFQLVRAFTSPFAQDDHVLRMISYVSQENARATLAQDHQDRSLITAHVYENMGGLNLHTDTSPVSYRQQAGKMLVFAGKQMAIRTGATEWFQPKPGDTTALRHTTVGGKIPAVWHGALTTPETVGKERHVIVSFLKGGIPFKNQ
jgi:hypothetical protein